MNPQEEAQRLSATFAELALAAMKDAGMTQSELAEAVGVTRPRMSHLLHHGRNLTLASVAGVATALGLRVRIELVPPRETTLEWTKASTSERSEGCIEVAPLPDGGVAIRTSRRPTLVHRLSAHEWECFSDGIRAGEFGHPE